jgi:DNA polymerase III subunit beta
MHFVTGKQTFLKELGYLQAVTEKKATIPILSNLLLETGEGGLNLKGTDLDLSLMTYCEVDVKKPGAVCVPARRLFEIVKSLPDAEIEIKVTEEHQVTLKCERSTFRLVGLAKTHFPEIASSDAQLASLPAKLLATFISRSIFAITNEESRYALNGARLELSSTGVRMVATDGHRLAFIERGTDFYQGDKLEVLIPKKALGELAKLCAEADGEVGLGRDENHLYFKIKHRLLVTRLLTGQFPNYELVLPKSELNPALFDTGTLLAALKRAALMADDKSHSVKMEFQEGTLKITAQSNETGDAEVVIPADYQGPAVTIGFNAEYLMDFLNLVEREKVQLGLKDGSSQTLFTLPGEDELDFRYVVMPMRL